MSENNKKITFLIGPPGCGKGTQAEMLAKKFGLFHFETAKIIEDKIKSGDPDDEVLADAKKNWESGELVDAKVVEKWVMEKVRSLSQEGSSIVFSGSPRTLYEVESELPSFEELYDRNNIKVVEIKLSENESIKRNSHRRICKLNRHPIPNFPEFENIDKCPEDDSEIITRPSLDDPETIKTRYSIYMSETEPVLDFFKSKGYNVIEINGEQPIEKVHEDIINQLLITN